MPGHLQAVEGNPIHSSHSTLQQISQTHELYISLRAAIPAPEQTPGVGPSASHLLPTVTQQSTMSWRESCCTTQTKGVTHCPPALNRSPLGVAYHSKQNFPLLPLKPNYRRTALEHVTPKPEEETLCALHMAPLGHFGCITVSLAPKLCFCSSETPNTPR